MGLQRAARASFALIRCVVLAVDVLGVVLGLALGMWVGSGDFRMLWGCTGPDPPPN
jgi:hypothetical protein